MFSKEVAIKQRVQLGFPVFISKTQYLTVSSSAGSCTIEQLNSAAKLRTLELCNN